MKILFRITALMIAVHMILSCTAVYSAEKTEAVDQRLFDLLYATQALQSNEIPQKQLEEKVTRIDAVYYALRTIGYTPEEIENAYERVYQDVAKNDTHAGAATLACKLGIISLAEKFYPYENVTANQAMRIFVSALGFGLYAEKCGGYSKGYLKVANDIELSKGFYPTGEIDITYGDLVKLMNNALFAHKLELTLSTGDIKYEIDSESCILNSVYDIYEIKGIVRQTAVTSLNLQTGLGGKKIGINKNSYFTANDDLYNGLSSYLGYKVSAYIKDTGDNDRTIVAFRVSDDNDVTTIFSEDYIRYESNTIEYKKGSTTKRISISPSANVIYNGKAKNGGMDNSIFTGKWGEISVVENKEGEQTVLITAYENYVVTDVDYKNYIVYDNTQNDRKFDFDVNDSVEYAVFMQKNGQKMEFNDITAGTVLSIAASADMDCFRVIAAAETVSGEIKNISSDTENNGDEVTIINIDSNTYKTAPNFFTDRVLQLQLNVTYEFGLDAAGRIAAVNVESRAGQEYAFLINATAYDDIEKGEMTIRFKLLTSYGKVETIYAADKVQVDGETYKSKRFDEIITYLMDGGSAVKSQIIMFEVNDSSELKSMDTVKTRNSTNQNDKLRTIYASDKAHYKSGSKTFLANVACTPMTKLFFYPAGKLTTADKGEDDDYGVTTISGLNNDSTYSIIAVNKDEESLVADAIAIAGSTGVEKKNQNYIMTVSKVKNSIDVDDMPIEQITGLYNGEERTYNIPISKYPQICGLTGKGDSIVFGLNSVGEINDISILYDYSADVSTCNNEEMDNHDILGANSGRQTVYGSVYSREDGFITVCKDINKSPLDKTNPKRVFATSGAKVHIVEDGDEGLVVRVGSAEEIKDYYVYGSNCSCVLVQTRYFEPRTIVVYQK